MINEEQMMFWAGNFPLVLAYLNSHRLEVQYIAPLWKKKNKNLLNLFLVSIKKHSNLRGCLKRTKP